jgi:hypothetical protein
VFVHVIKFVAGEVQVMLGALHPPEQNPPRHTWPVVHACPHMPQFPMSLSRSTQFIPHIARPAGQRHPPSVHVDMPVQTVPHMPQFMGSEFRSTHIASGPAPHAVRPVGHMRPQWLMLHD